MWAYIVCAVIWVAIIAGWLIPAIRKRIFYEVYMTCGLGILFSLIVLGQMASIWERSAIHPLLYIGYVLYVPAAALVISSFINLKREGKPEPDWEHTIVIIGSGVFRIVRHPLYLGSAFFVGGLILIIQSIPSTILGLVAIFCFWMASKGEDEFNVKKFGEEYRKYMAEIPGWNLFKGLKQFVNKSGKS